MNGFLTVILVLAMLGVLGALGLGMANLFTGGSPRRSNKLMQMRVIMQGVALLVLALLMLAGHR
ncbi:MAG TPA: twin transmembrane helix small protein [Stellaceae bacterium]|nr:twin transmembrane helix small protein [Stellaceae bacterium]